MHSPIFHSPEAPFSNALKAGAVVVYEDIIAGQLGWEIARQFGCQTDVDELEITVWNAALLDEPYFSGIITDQCAEADLIVVAIHGAEGLNQSLKRWIHRWTVAEQNKRRAIIVAVQEPGVGAAREIPTFVIDTARRAGKDFFREQADSPPNGGDRARHESLWLI